MRCQPGRSEHGEHDQPRGAGVPHAMRHVGRRHQQVAGAHRQCGAVEQEHALARDHVVDLVHAGMGVQRVRLARLEGVHPDQQARRREERGLAHATGREHGVVFGPDDGGMGQHARRSSEARPAGGTVAAWTGH